jgi:hypothetical protein
MFPSLNYSRFILIEKSSEQRKAKPSFLYNNFNKKKRRVQTLMGSKER